MKIKIFKNIVIKKLLQKNDLSKYRITDTKKDYLYMKNFFQNIKGLCLLKFLKSLVFKDYKILNK